MRALALCVLVAVTSAARAQQTSSDVFSLNPSKDASRICTTKDGREGECVYYTNCDNNHTLITYGDIDENEIRAGNCPGKLDWCCADPQAAKTPQVSSRNQTDSECLLAEDVGKCPWCVSLYRDGGNPSTKSKTGLYCGGAMLAGRAVVTSAACVLAARGQHVTVRTALGHDRHVLRAFMHPQYNSGTGQYDVALLLLVENGTLSEERGGCLPAADIPPSTERCVAPGWGPDSNGDYNEIAIENHITSLTDGRCGRGNVAGAICARWQDECTLSVGSPLLCGAKSGPGLQVAGVVSAMGCGRTMGGAGGTALWNPTVARWIEDILHSIGVVSRQFIAT